MIHSILESLSVIRHFFIPRTSGARENFIIVDEFSRGSFAKCSVVVFVLPSHFISLTLQRMLCKKKTQEYRFYTLEKFILAPLLCSSVSRMSECEVKTTTSFVHHQNSIIIWSGTTASSSTLLGWHFTYVKWKVYWKTSRFSIFKISNGVSIKRAEVNDELFIGKYEEVEKWRKRKKIDELVWLTFMERHCDILLVISTSLSILSLALADENPLLITLTLLRFTFFFNCSSSSTTFDWFLSCWVVFLKIDNFRTISSHSGFALSPTMVRQRRQTWLNFGGTFLCIVADFSLGNFTE